MSYAVRRVRLTLPVFIALVFCSSSVFAQNTIHVPGDQPTIQGAINIANNGDTVLVAPGTYTENINFGGKAITVTSSGGASATTIDGGGASSVVTFASGEGSGSILNGFTIQNGAASFEGGGIDISSASLIITNNVIQTRHVPTAAASPSASARRKSKETRFRTILRGHAPAGRAAAASRLGAPATHRL